MKFLCVSCVACPVSAVTAPDDICELKLTAKLNAFGITVCDQTCRIADIRIQGKGFDLNIRLVCCSKKYLTPLHSFVSERSVCAL